MPHKVKVSVDEKGVLVVANRDGLLDIAEVCTQLAALPEDADESRQLGNHHHFAEWMNNAEPGSVPLEVLYDPAL